MIQERVFLNTREHLNQLYENSPEKSVELLVSDYIDVLKVLYFVAKADGQYRKEEKEIVGEYLRRLIKDSRISDKLIDDELRYMDIPSLQAFKNAVGRIVRGGQVNPGSLEQCCKDIVTTQSFVHPHEKVALDYINNKVTEFYS